MAGSCRSVTSDHGLFGVALLTFEDAASSSPYESFSRIRRDDLNDRDVSTRSLRAPVLIAAFVAVAVIARHCFGRAFICNQLMAATARREADSHAEPRQSGLARC
jgi:hypothetical protein